MSTRKPIRRRPTSDAFSILRLRSVRLAGGFGAALLGTMVLLQWGGSGSVRVPETTQPAESLLRGAVVRTATTSVPRTTSYFAKTSCSNLETGSAATRPIRQQRRAGVGGLRGRRTENLGATLDGICLAETHEDV